MEGLKDKKPSKIFTNKSEAPLTTSGDSSQFSPDWK